MGQYWNLQEIGFMIFTIVLRQNLGFYSSIRPGYHMNKRHWVSVDFDNRIPRRVEEELIRHAYYQTARGLSRKLRAELGFDF